MTAQAQPASPSALASVPGEVDVPPEAIVVGSGFGGAVTAARLAQAGLRVLLVERGRRFEAGDFPDMPADAALLPDLRRWTWQGPGGQGLWDILDLEEVVSVQAAGYGGGSLIYANVHLRPPREVFDARWPSAYQGGAALEEYFDLAAAMLDAAPIDTHQEIGGAPIKADQLRKAARHLGREEAFFHPPLAVNRSAGVNAFGRQQKACNGCGACCTGCPETAKNTLDFNYLAVAESHGVHVVTQCEVVDVRQLGPQKVDGNGNGHGDASGANGSSEEAGVPRNGAGPQKSDGDRWQVDCVDHLNARRRRFSARYLFLCAGSVHSTRLMARARLSQKARAVKSVVGVGYFPGGDALGVVYDTTHPQHPSFGPAITTATVCWAPPGEARGGVPRDDASFFLLQDGGYARPLERLVGMLRAPAWVGRNRLTRAGAAAIPPTPRRPPPAPPGPLPPPLSLVSPIDDVLAAVTGGDLRHVASHDLRAEWASFLEEVRDPLLLPAIVDRTIELSIRERLRALWLTRWIPPEGWLTRLIVRVEKWIVRKTFGTNDDLAARALRGVLTGSGLAPAEIARRVLGYSAGDADRRVMMLAMGRDAARGVLHYDGRRDRLVADLDLYHLAPGYTDEERLMTDVAGALGGELRTNPAWAFLGKPITVHNQGGCGMSDDPALGVTAPDGQVHGCDGLYISDGSVLCTSVGVNPSATITAIAERNALAFIRAHKGDPAWPAGDDSDGAREYRSHRERARTWAANAAAAAWAITPPRVAASVPFRNQPLGIGFHEVMQGHYQPGGELPNTDAQYRDRETAGRPAFPVRVDLDVSAANLAIFYEDERHLMQLGGTIKIRLPDDAEPVELATAGTLDLFVKRYKTYGIGSRDVRRRAAHEHFAGTAYKTHRGRPPRGEERLMRYELGFADRGGRKWLLRGYKRIRDDPGLDAWRDTSALFVSLLGPPEGGGGGAGAEAALVPRGAGTIHVDLDGFLFNQLPSLRIVGGGDDRTRAMWAKAKFATFFFGTLQRIYAPEVRSAIEALFKPNASQIRSEPPR